MFKIYNFIWFEHYISIVRLNYKNKQKFKNKNKQKFKKTTIDKKWDGITNYV